MKNITVRKNDAGQRLDKFLVKLLPTMPKSLLFKSIRKKRIKIGGKAAYESYILSTGDVLEIYINDEFFENKPSKNKFLTMPQHLDVIFEDENILAVYKPSGLIVHEDENEKQNTLINRVKAYLYKNGEYDPAVENSFAPALCHRLDRNTAGLVICAKNFATLQIMNEKIKNDEIEKHYRCLTCGVPRPARGTISTYLFKDEKNNQVYVCGKSHANAKSAITKYKVLGAKNNIALVDVNLITGRTHQIRVHFAHIGCPILGDNKYGSKEVNRKFRQKYQCLVAYKIKFNFQTDAGILNYLKDKIIELDEKFSCFDLK